MSVTLAGCSGGSGDGAGSESAGGSAATAPSVRVPAAVTLTDPGTSLDLGQPASVVYDAGQQRVSVITVTVRKVVAGSMRRDFKDFALGPKLSRSTPYYVTATVRNDGPGRLPRAPVPLFGHDSTNTFFPAATLVGDLGVCPGGPLPAPFGPKASQRSCRVFLVGKGARLDGVELRPYAGFDPITWSVPESVSSPRAGAG